MSAINLPNHNLTFLHIPKNGGSSIVKWLQTNIPEHDVIRSHSSLSMLSEHWKIERVFTTVRNPWARVVSSYFYLKQSGFYWEFNNIHSEDQFPTWEQYIKNLDFKLSDWNTLKTNQYEWMDGKVDYILKCENLNEDFKQIQELLGCSEPLPYINTSKHDDYRTYYNTEQQEFVRKIFEKDIDLFGYTF